jgi:dephospho-CoA kinase
MIIIGLTGSIGMGKSTTAELFADAGVPVNDSDAVVHDLYNGEAVPLIAKAFPGTVTAGAVDRKKLSELLKLNPAKFTELEAIVHPLVRMKEQAFLNAQEANDKDIVLLDIPLLYETGADSRVDVVVVVTCEEDIQRERVLNRPGMTEEKFAMIKARQMPDRDKRLRADFIIDTGHGIENARRRVTEVLAALRAGKRKDDQDA